MRIALVEDNPGDVRWFTITIGEMGIPREILVFESGIAAIEAFHQSAPPDLILSNWRLPILEFEDFVHLVRAVPGYETTPIAVVTSDSDHHRERAQALGAICCLEKPVDAEQLGAVFEKAGVTSKRPGVKIASPAEAEGAQFRQNAMV